MKVSDEISSIINLLDSPDKKVRKDAVKKLKDFGKEASVPLLKALDSNSEQVRTAAAEILGTFSEDAIPVFLNLLVSGSENARDGAAKTIGQIVKNGSSVTEYISDMIADKNSKSRKGAALALGNIVRPDKNSINMLVFLLRDENSEVRDQAAKSLDKINWNSANQTERAYYYLATEDWDSLGKSGVSSIPALSFGIEILDIKAKKKIASVLAKIDDKNSGSLLKLLLSDNDGSVRQAAVAAIADKRDESLNPLLVQSMNDPDHNVRVEAAWSLEKTGWRPKNYYEKAKSLILRGNYAEAGRMGEYAIPCLIEFLGDDFYDNRENAIRILSSLGKPGMDAVKEALKSPFPEIKKGAAEAIVYMREEEVKSQEKKAEEFLNNRKKAFDLNSPEYWEEKLLLAGFGNDISLRFSKSLSNEDPVIRIVAVESLKKFGKSSAEILILLIDDENENVKVASIEALGDLYEKKALPRLLETMEDENEKIRRACAYSLGKIRDIATIPVLIRHFSDPDENVRYECSHAVAKMGNPAIPFIENMIFHQNELVRISSLNALGEISDPYGIPLATRSLNDPDFNVRNEAMQALLKISNFMFNFLMGEVHRVSIQGTKMEKLGILSVLSKTGDMKVVPYVKEYLGDEDEEVRRNARTILDIFTEREITKEREKIREYSRETANLLRRKLTLEDIDSLLDRVLNANDNDALEVLKKKLSQEEIDELIRNAKSSRKKDTSKLLGKKLSQEEIDELLHRSVYVENKKTTILLGKKLTQEEIDDLINRAGTEKDEKAAKDIKKQLTQNEIDNIIKKELELKKKIAMEVSRLIVGLKSDDPSVSKDYSDKIVRIGEPAVEPLISTMSSADSGFQNLIADILIRTGKPGIRGMIRVLNYGKPEIKILVAKKVADSGEKEAYDALYDRIFSEKDPDVKKVLVESFGTISDARVFDAAAHALKDKNPAVRAAAVKILGRLKDDRAIDLIISLFEDSNPGVRDLALNSLKPHGKRAKKSLLSALKSNKKDSYKEMAAKALEALGFVPKEREDLLYFNIAVNQWDEVTKAGPAAIPPLFEILKDPYSVKRAKALDSLIKIDTKISIYPISYLLFDMDEALSGKAREALLKTGAGALGQLKKIASDNEDSSQKEYLYALIKEIEETEIIKSYISDRRWDELENMGTAALGLLSQLLSDKDADLKLNAVKTIGKIGTPESVIPLVKALSDSDIQVSAAARAYLKKTGADALPLLIKTRENSGDPKTRVILESVIKEIEQNERIKSFIINERWDLLKKEGMPALNALGVLQKSRNPQTRLNAVTVMAEMKMAESIPGLARAFIDSDTRVSDAGKKGLLKHGRKALPILMHIEKLTANTEKKDAVRKLILEIKEKADDDKFPAESE